MVALPSPPIYLPFVDAQWQLKMGLKPLSPEEWIAIDEEFEFYLTCKTELLQHQASEMYGSSPGSEPAQQEALFLLLEYLVTHFPQYYDRQGDHVTCSITHQSWNITEFLDRPLELAALLIQEDLCLMQSTSSGYVFTAGCVCFPSHWSLLDKLGKPLAEIHQPVPGYAEMLENRVNAVFDRLRVDHSLCRLNWGIVDCPDLPLIPHERSSYAAPSLTVENIAKHLWLRVERQTLRRLPQTQAVLFTIRIYRYPLSIIELYPKAAQSLSINLQQMPALMQQYKNLASVQNMLLEYLNSVSANELSSLNTSASDNSASSSEDC